MVKMCAVVTQIMLQ